MGTVSGIIQGVGMMPLLLLFAGHALCDYPLQGPFLSEAKNPRKPIPGIPWEHALIAHALIHAGMVALITGSFTIGMCEFTVHFVTDWCKCEGKLTFNQDQAIHYACKVAWWMCIVAFK
jgi:hypothetical protein